MCAELVVLKSGSSYLPGFSKVIETINVTLLANFNYGVFSTDSYGKIKRDDNVIRGKFKDGILILYLRELTKHNAKGFIYKNHTMIDGIYAVEYYPEVLFKSGYIFSHELEMSDRPYTLILSLKDNDTCLEVI